MPFNNKRNSRDDKSGKPRRANSPHSPSSKRGYRDDSKAPYGKRSSDDKPSFKSGPGRPFRNSPKWGEERNEGDRQKSRFSDDRRHKDDRPRFDSKNRNERGERRYGDDKPRFGSDNRNERGERRYGDDKPRFGSDNRNDRGERRYGDDKPRFDENRKRSDNRRHDDDRPRFDRHQGKDADRRRRKDAPGQRTNAHSEAYDDKGLIRLNRYISNAGICSRRKADDLIEAGVITVNGETVTELGTKVDPAKDEVRYNGERLRREKLVYVLLNKPKDYITTMDDPQERRTVMHLVASASRERIYPVGRLDRNTLGLLLMTNDGNLAEKLAHPRNNISKIYQVELNKNLTQGDLNKIAFGLELEDGFVKPDDISYVQGGSKREIGIQIHSGRNRIVRRIFEHLGYEVIKLDRVVYAHLTKKDLPRGRWRYLTDKEIIQLKHFMK